MKALSASVSVLMVTGAIAVAHAVAEAPDFARYQVILSRMPFGAEPVVQTGVGANAPSVPPAESFTKNLKMCAVTRNDITGKLQVGLVDAVTKKNYFLKVGEEEDGIRLMDADYEGEKALLKKGVEEVWITMSSGVGLAVAAVGAPRGAMPMAAVAPTPAMGLGRPPAQVGSRVGLTTGAGRAAATTNAAAIIHAERLNPELTGEALQKHLEQYQMDLIRSGGAKGPPLPMQLTPEMDQQLVKEGVLSP